METTALPGSRSRWSQASNIERAWWIFAIPFRALLCFSNCTLFFLTYFGYILPVLWAKSLWPRLYWFYEGCLYKMLEAFVGFWGYTADYDVYEFGEDISRYHKNRVLVLCNHQSTADVPSLFAILQSKGVAARKTMWIISAMFRRTPFGIIAQTHGDYFIKSSKDSNREAELDRMKDHLRKIFWDRDRRWVIVFPEGGFYYKRVAVSQEYGRKHNYPHLEHTTLPRFGAVKAILEEIGPRYEDNTCRCGAQNNISNLKYIADAVRSIRVNEHVKETRPPIEYVLDVTIAYPNAQPLSIFTLVFGSREKCDIAVHYQMYKIDEVPFDDNEKLRKWMYKLYAKKDKMLDNYYKTGSFNPGEYGHRIAFSWWEIITLYIFWFVSFAIQLVFYKWLLQQLLSLAYFLLLKVIDFVIVHLL